MKLFSIFDSKEKKQVYKCSCCGQVFEDLQLCFGSDFPDFYYSLTENEQQNLVEKTESLCVINEEHFFVRGRLIIPIVDHTENLIWDIWSSVSKENFIRTNDLWNDPNRINEEPYFGWFQSIIPTYQNTINIRSLILTEPVGQIPLIKIIEENHPLKHDQELGITLRKAYDIVDVIMRQQHKPNNT